MSQFSDALGAVKARDIPESMWLQLFGDLNGNVTSQKQQIDVWVSTQQYLKANADAKTAAIQAMSFLASPYNIGNAIENEKIWIERHPGENVPDDIAVPSALREAFNKYRVQQVEADAKVKTANQLLGITPAELAAAAGDPAKMAALIQSKAPNARTAEAKEALANYQSTVELALKSFQLKSAEAEMAARIADAKSKSNVMGDLLKKYHVGTGQGEKSIADAAADGTLLKMLTEATNAEDQTAIQVLGGLRDVLVKYQTLDAEVKKIKADAITAEGQAAEGLAKVEKPEELKAKVEAGTATTAEANAYQNYLQLNIKTATDDANRVITQNAEAISNAFQPFVMRMGQAFSNGRSVTSSIGEAAGVVLSSGPQIDTRGLVAQALQGPGGNVDVAQLTAAGLHGGVASLRNQGAPTGDPNANTTLTVQRSAMNALGIKPTPPV